MRIRTAALLCLLPLFATGAATQEDDAAVAKWIEQLGDDNVQVREAAEKALIRLGERALVPLKKAMHHSNAEIRARAGDAYRRIRWTQFRRDYAADLNAEEKRLLEKNQASDWIRRGGVPLMSAFEVLDVSDPVEQKDLPEKGDRLGIWSFLDERALGERIVHRAEAGDVVFWRVKSEKWLLHATVPKDGRWPRFYILEPLKEKFELTAVSVKWDPKTTHVPCLSGIADPAGWRHLIGGGESIQEAGRVRSAFYSFMWAQRKPFPSLRYVFLSQGFALFCTSYQ